MQFITGKSYVDAIEKLLRTDNPDKRVQCAVAFWGDGAKRYLKYLGPKSKVICNLQSGATNPHLIEAMQEHNVPVRTLDSRATHEK